MHTIAAWWSSISPNLQASLLWAVPGFVTHHVLTRRHITAETDRQTAVLTAHIDQAAAAPAKEPAP